MWKYKATWNSVSIPKMLLPPAVYIWSLCGAYHMVGQKNPVYKGKTVLFPQWKYVSPDMILLSVLLPLPAVLLVHRVRKPQISSCTIISKIFFKPYIFDLFVLKLRHCLNPYISYLAEQLHLKEFLINQSLQFFLSPVAHLEKSSRTKYR